MKNESKIHINVFLLRNQERETNTEDSKYENLQQLKKKEREKERQRVRKKERYQCLLGRKRRK